MPLSSTVAAGDVVTSTGYNNLRSDALRQATDRALVIKSAAETVNNDTTLQDDDELLFAIGTNETWIVELYILFSSGTTADLKIAFTTPAGGGVVGNIIGHGDTAPLDLTSSQAITWISGVGVLDVQIAKVVATAQTGGTAGNITLQWAQNSVEVTDTIVEQGSMLIAWRVV